MIKISEINIKEEMEKVGFRFGDDFFYYSPELTEMEIPSKKEMLLSLRRICVYLKRTGKDQYTNIDKFIEEIYFLMANSISEKMKAGDLSLYILILMDNVDLMWINIKGKKYMHSRGY